mmetsp:Transcript_10917/g.19090  ORF Transcript_10917/g.19090 Transcript_10917/m.19090 type:complete len:322 (-) Transcript_10917:204-1169(-)|eukprot:CAMPEP_0183727334 /NCGR_PEP_ID=MMETSP0737-20130205/25433_1 /TAXON_ID=385413 /ORGANISM="Thalassiosira miniscula, Strain CCMP1093" /LENGTH=321 /DNA_ID=CAMNT_0025958935 /DNA_START=178 /DNA_END=1143 /DNA_ORIENTATION=-
MHERASRDCEAGNSGETLKNDKQELHRCIITMLKQEQHYVCHNYLKGNKHKIVGAIDATCRFKVCQWIFQTVRQARLQSETAIIAISYLDRFLCSNSSRAARARCDRREYQLVAMASLYIAIKIHEPIEMTAASMSQLSRGFHSAEDITSCEMAILTSLRWKIQGPTPFQFISYILELLPADEDDDSPVRSSGMEAMTKLREVSQREAEVAVEDHGFIHLRRSTIAIASILNSLDCVPKDIFSSTERAHFIQVISDTFHIDVDSPLVKAIRSRIQNYSRKLARLESSQRRATRERQVKVVSRATAQCSADAPGSPGCVSRN